MSSRVFFSYVFFAAVVTLIIIYMGFVKPTPKLKKYVDFKDAPTEETNITNTNK